MKMGERLERLRERYPKKASTGMMYDGKATNKAIKRIKVWAVLVSDEGLAELMGIIVEHPSKPKTPKAWQAWLAKYFSNILGAVISSKEQETGELWKTRAIFGWSDDTNRKRSATRPRRRKTVR